jgi:hypothetical protein
MGRLDRAFRAAQRFGEVQCSEVDSEAMRVHKVPSSWLLPAFTAVGLGELLVAS